MPRLLRTHFGYVAMSTAVLAVSIGVNLVVFTVVNALWIRPLPFPEPERVVTIPQASVTTLEQPRLKIFEGGVAGQVITSDTYEGLRPRIEVDGVGHQVETLGVTSGYFSVLRLAIRGRNFTSDDDREGAEPVAIISDRLWQQAFDRRVEVLGAVLPTKPIPIRIIGVAPAGFEGARRGEQADLWVPISVVRRFAPADWSSSGLPMMVIARLGAGQTAAIMEQRYRELMEPRMRDWMLAYNPSGLPTVIPLTDVFGTPESRTLLIRERDPLLVVSGLAMLVLFAGCATIAALVLMHYERRRGELALKISLGASRGRLVFELLRDLSLVAATGSAGGILVAVLGVRVVPALSLPGGVNIGRLDLSIDWRVCAVAIVASILTVFAAAALPVARSTRVRLAGELFAGPSATTLGSLRMRQSLLAFQVCATIIVLIAAGLFVRAVIHGFGGAAGFDVNRTLFVSVQEGASLRNATADPQSVITERSARLMPILREMPGVSDVAEGMAPIGSDASSSSLKSKTFKVSDQEYQLLAGVLTGSPNLLSTLGVPIVAGRHLTAADLPAMPHPAIITQSLAQRLWPEGGPLGQAFSLPQLRGGSYIVVGIARDFAFGSVARRGTGVVVTAGPGTSSILSNFVIRTDHPEIVLGAVRRTIKGQVVRVATGKEIVARDIGRQRLGAWFFSGFGLAALLLGVSGAFGLVAYLVESQRREFGVRLALGASMWHLVRRGLNAALGPVSAGVAAGLALGGIAAQVFAALLVGISALDVITYLLVAVTMLSCTAIVALAAAWRLRRTTPSDALRAT